MGPHTGNINPATVPAHLTTFVFCNNSSCLADRTSVPQGTPCPSCGHTTQGTLLRMVATAAAISTLQAQVTVTRIGRCQRLWERIARVLKRRR